MESPSRELAQRIVRRLIEEEILTPERGDKIQSDLSEGSLKAEDWQLEIELSKQELKELDRA